MNRVIVCGGIDFRDRQMIAETLELLPKKFGGRGFMLVHGDCKGADRLCGLWAEKHGVRVETKLIDELQYAGMAAQILNRQMLSLGADLVIAFPGGRSTENMAELAEEAGVELWRPGLWSAEEQIVFRRSREELSMDVDDEVHEVFDIEVNFKL